MQIKLLSLFLLFTLATSAQMKFVSQSVKKIYDQLPVICKKQLIEKNECECLIQGAHYYLKLKTDENVISNVGLKVFNDTVTNNTINFINSFVEREFLKFILDDNEERETRRREDFVYIYYANSFKEYSLLKTAESISKVITDISGISLKQDSLKYNLVITNSLGEKIGLEFPAIISLISGMDKKELDEYFYTDLLKDIPINPNVSQRQLYHTFNNEGDLLVDEGEHFIIEDFSSHKYYKREKDTIKLVYDKKYISKSLSNLFLAGEPTNHQILIDLKIKGYGNDDKNKLITVNNLLAHFNNQFELYFGIEDTCNDQLRGTLLIHNSSLNYLHLIDIKTDVESLFKDPGHLVGTIYSYIPTHNIKDLFGKDEMEKSILLDDILNEKAHEKNN